MGRVLTAAGILGIIAIIAMFLMSSESAATAGSRFMRALYTSDAKTLTDMTYWPNQDRSVTEEKWKKTLGSTKYYSFTYKVMQGESSRADQANVRLLVERNTGAGSYEENFALPMIKKDGKWLVDVTNLNRNLYPWLPR